MAVRIELTSLLRKFVPNYDAEAGILLEDAEGKSIQQIIEELAIPPKKVFTIIVNHYPGNRSYIAKDGDHIVLAMTIGAG
jgi:hypothetical protein